MTDELAARREQQDEVIITALSFGGSYADAAVQAGTSARTVRRRMADPAFALAVSRRRAERSSEITGQLLHASIDAVRVLRECLDSESDAVRVRASRTLIELGGRMRLVNELEERLARLEGNADDL